MKSPTSPAGLPLDYAAEVAFELHLMRGECSDAARRLMHEASPSEEALEECALLDESLRGAHSLLQGTVARIRQMRAGRQPRRPWSGC